MVSGYGDSEILHGASLDVEDGQITAILGPNGAGKTTLLKTIMGILRARSGKVYFEGRDITKSSTSEILRRGLYTSHREEASSLNLPSRITSRWELTP